MPDPKLDIKISTSGAAQAARDIEGVGKAADKAGQEAGKAGKSAGQGFQQFSKAGSDAANVINNLETASKGGIAGIFGIANAMRSLIGIVRGAVAATGPLGLLVTLLGTGLAAAMAIFGRESKSAEKSVEALTKKAQELGKVQLEQLKGQLSAIAESASDAVSEFDRLAKAAGEVDRAETAARIARLKARTDISEAERTRAISAEEQGLSDRTRSSGIKSLENAEKYTREAQTEALAETARVGEKLAAATAKLDDLTRRRDAANELRNLSLAGFGGANLDLDPKMAARMRELQDIVGKGPEVTDADIAGAKEEVDQFRTAVGAAEAALAELTRAFRAAFNALETGRTTAQQVGAAEKQERAANLDVALRSTPQYTPVDTSARDAAGAEYSRINSLLGPMFSHDPRRPGLEAQRDAAKAAYDQADAEISSRNTANERLRYEQQRAARPTGGPARLQTYSGTGKAQFGEDGVLRGAGPAPAAFTRGDDGVLRNAQAMAQGMQKMELHLDGFFSTTAAAAERTAKKAAAADRRIQKTANRVADSR